MNRRDFLVNISMVLTAIALPKPRKKLKACWSSDATPDMEYLKQCFAKPLERPVFTNIKLPKVRPDRCSHIFFMDFKYERSSLS